MYRPGEGWFADLSPASEPLETTVTVVDPASLDERLFLPFILRDEAQW
jgi:hypothetical protein